MDKVTQLIVRACKSRDPEVRLKTLYRRFYLVNPDDDQTVYFHMAGLLSTLCDNYLDVRMSRIVGDLCPSNQWKFGVNEDDSYWQGIVKVLTSYVRGAHRDSFPGLTPPAMFREKKPSKPDILDAPIEIIDEDWVWQVDGALSQFDHDCVSEPSKRPRFIDDYIREIDDSLTILDEIGVQSLRNKLIDQRLNSGELTLSYRDEATTILAALLYVKDRVGFHGIDWVYNPDFDIVRTLIARLTSELKR